MRKNSRGHWTEKIIISELEPIIKEMGYFPTQSGLDKMGKSDLHNAMRRHGGFNYFREKMGYDIIRKSKRSWTEKNITFELELAIEELGHFPTQTKLNETGRSGLVNATRRYGGINHFREKMGYEIIRRPKGYWTDERIISELGLIIKELDHFPSYPELKALNKTRLSGAIICNCGINYFREKMGYKPLRQKSENGLTNVCGIIKKHHDDLKDDPNRLSTEFLQNIIGSNCDV